MNADLLMRAVRGIPPIRAEAWLNAMLSAWDEFAITDIERPMWLAQCGHESASFTRCRELWGPTAQQLRYERSFGDPWPSSDAEARQAKFHANALAYRLGNAQKGDGGKFRGHGPIQITGRGNHERCGKALGLDLIENPSLIATDPLQGARSACWFWVEHGVGRNSRDVEAATRVINGGINGLDDRRARYQLALSVL